MAGFVLGVESVPDALASGVLAGVNPLFALYAVMLATPVGAFFASSVFLSVQTTGAMSVVVASVPEITSQGPDTRAIFMLAFLTGVIMLVAGFLKLGRLMRFVSNSVMVGFMNGVALIIILGQLGNFTGYYSGFGNRVVRAFDLLFHLHRSIFPPSLWVSPQSCSSWCSRRPSLSSSAWWWLSSWPPSYRRSSTGTR
jgi:sulfate permease, SulP family